MTAHPLRVIVAEDNEDLRDLLVTIISAEPDMKCVGTASDATVAMELGADGVLMNSAIAGAKEPGTMAEAMKAMEHCGLTVKIGPAWFDIDDPADLDRLRSEPDLPPYTAAALGRITAMRQGTG